MSEKDTHLKELEKSYKDKISEMEDEFENLRQINKGLEDKIEEMKAASSG